MKMPLKIGRFPIKQIIGEGAMGIVYKAEDPNTHNRIVAIKVIKRSNIAQDENDKDIELDRFLKEAKIMAQLGHPNIIHLNEIGEHNGNPFIVMEYFEGITLKKLIHGSSRPDFTELLNILRHISYGLNYAHSHGIIHRDLKPGNIMINPTSGIAKIMDFGIAKGGETELTKKGYFIGTPHYSSPEQFSNSNTIDSRSDVFSLAILTHEMFTGYRPFTGDDIKILMFKIIYENPEIIRFEQHLGVDSDHWVKVLSRALQKKPQDRYNKTIEFYEDLKLCFNKKVQSAEKTKIIPKPTIQSLATHYLLSALLEKENWANEDFEQAKSLIEAQKNRKLDAPQLDILRQAQKQIQDRLESRTISVKNINEQEDTGEKGTKLFPIEDPGEIEAHSESTTSEQPVAQKSSDKNMNSQNQTPSSPKSESAEVRRDGDREQTQRNDPASSGNQFKNRIAFLMSFILLIILTFLILHKMDILKPPSNPVDIPIEDETEPKQLDTEQTPEIKIQVPEEKDQTPGNGTIPEDSSSSSDNQNNLTTLVKEGNPNLVDSHPNDNEHPINPESDKEKISQARGEKNQNDSGLQPEDNEDFMTSSPSKPPVKNNSKEVIIPKEDTEPPTEPPMRPTTQHTINDGIEEGITDNKSETDTSPPGPSTETNATNTEPDKFVEPIQHEKERLPILDKMTKVDLKEKYLLFQKIKFTITFNDKNLINQIESIHLRWWLGERPTTTFNESNIRDIITETPKNGKFSFSVNKHRDGRNDCFFRISYTAIFKDGSRLDSKVNYSAHVIKRASH